MSTSYGFNSVLVFFFFFEKYNNKKSTKKHALSFLKKHKKASVKHASLNEPSFQGKKCWSLGVSRFEHKRVFTNTIWSKDLLRISF